METINIAFASDNHYAQHMAVSIASLVKNASGHYRLCIYILHENLLESHIENLKVLVGLRRNTEMYFLKLSMDDFRDFPLHTGAHSIATYFRLKLPSLLPDVDRIAYLDSDIVVCRDIQEIWQEFTIAPHMIWAVEEPTPLYSHRLASLGMSGDSPYFNGGILLLNLEKMRQTNFEGKARDYIEKYYDAIYYQDQDVLNALSEGDWKPMPLCWNSFFFVMEGIYRGKYSQYSNDDIENAKMHPAIIHYNQHPKPWAAGCIDPRRKQYFKYLENTPYQGFKVDQSKSYLPILKQRCRYMIMQMNVNFPNLYRVLRFFKRALVKVYGFRTHGFRTHG